MENIELLSLLQHGPWLLQQFLIDFFFSPKESNTEPDFHVNKQHQCEQWSQRGTEKTGSNCWTCTCAWLLKLSTGMLIREIHTRGREMPTFSTYISDPWAKDWSAPFFDHFLQHPNSTGQSFSCNIFLHMVHAQYESWEVFSPGWLQVTSLGLTLIPFQKHKVHATLRATSHKIPAAKDKLKLRYILSSQFCNSWLR